MSDQVQVLTPIENRVLSLLKERYIEEGWAFSGCVPATDPTLARCARDGNDVLKAIAHLLELHYIQRRNCQALAYELTPAQRLELINGYDLDDYWQLVAQGTGDAGCNELTHVRNEVEKGNSNV